MCLKSVCVLSKIILSQRSLDLLSSLQSLKSTHPVQVTEPQGKFINLLLCVPAVTILTKRYSASYRDGVSLNPYASVTKFETHTVRRG